MLKRRLLPAVVVAVFVAAGCGSAGDRQDSAGGAQEAVGDKRDAAAEKAQEAPAGQTAADTVLAFTATTVEGEPFDAADLAGRPVVFWFWAPWCSTCVAEAPHVLDIADEYDDVQVVGVASLGQRPEMQDFIELTDTQTLTHLDDEEGAVWRHFEMTAQSTFALVNTAGEVTFSGFLAPDDLASRVSDLAA